jgi:hypothetical protein
MNICILVCAYGCVCTCIHVGALVRGGGGCGCISLWSNNKQIDVDCNIVYDIGHQPAHGGVSGCQ